MAPGFVRSVIGVKGIKNTLNYTGKSHSLFDPSSASSKLRARVSVLCRSLTLFPTDIGVTYGITIEIEGGHRPACIAEVIAVHYLQ